METTRYDTADYLKTEEDISAYLEEVFEDGDPALISHALGVVVRAEEMRKCADLHLQASDYDEYLRRKVELARSSMHAGRGRSNAEVAAAFAAKRNKVPVTRS